MGYRQAIALLDELIARHHTGSGSATTATAILERESALLNILGNPQHTYPSIHIAGTKGKGSTAAMVAAILQAAGYRVGLYTSPHLYDIRERIMVNGQYITEAAFADRIDRISPQLGAMSLGIRWFEAITAVAFAHFADVGVDIAVVEAGLGGHRDATNVITPVLSILTSISYDHTHLFGNSLVAIAAEKAGIIKPRVPVISAPQPLTIETVLRRVATAQQASLHMLDMDTLDIDEPTGDKQRFRLQVDRGNGMHLFQTNLIGKHQALNAALAIYAIEHLNTLNWNIRPDNIRSGLVNVRWPGRFEIVGTSPPVIIDAAHNAASAAHLSQTLEARFPGKAMTLLFGASADKDIVGMLQHYRDKTTTLVLTQASSGRAAAIHDLASMALDIGFSEQQIFAVQQAGAAVALAQHFTAKDAIIVATGSVYLVGEIRARLGLQLQTAAMSAATRLSKE